MHLEEFGRINELEVFEAISCCELIENYADDYPYPSALLLGHTAQNRPLHVVCAYSETEQLVIIVTVYHPDPERWEDGFRRRKT
jgi:hypothetical protein